MHYLFVVAHPDDEVLGAGATIHKLVGKGHLTSVCILSSEANARKNRPATSDLFKDLANSNNILGVDRLFAGEFPNIELNTVPHLTLVQFIENAILEVKPDFIFTHHPSDLNNDHHHTSIACQAAARVFQRNNKLDSLRDFLFMEVQSATEWGMNKAMNDFAPNTFVQVGEEGIDKKIEALSQYRGVMRNYPHPRSPEAIKGLAAYRGSQSGLAYAEAFQSVMRRIL